MKRFIFGLVVVLASGVAAAGGSARQGVDPDPKPPTLLGPAPSQALTVGTEAVFRIRTHANDRFLWLHVSRSRVVKNHGGTIGSEIALERFRPTAAGAVYEVRLRDLTTDSKPGTYYWQAYRMAGKDGYVESQVRVLRIMERPPLALSDARLEGDFHVVQKITAVEGFSTPVGHTTNIDYRFQPACGTGACNVAMSFGVSEFGIIATSRVSVPLTRQGSVYSGSTSASLSKCNFSSVTGTLDIRLDVTAGAWISNVWRAKTVTGTARYSTDATTVGIWQCGAAWWEATLTGSYGT